MIKVLFFAEMQEKTGEKEITIDAENISVETLKQDYLSKYGIDHLLNQALLAVNEEYQEADTILKNGDTVAFIPPVSGG